MSGCYPFHVEADHNTDVSRTSFKHNLLLLTVGNAQTLFWCDYWYTEHEIGQRHCYSFKKTILNKETVQKGVDIN